MPATNAVSTGEKTKGRKRHIATDTLGCILDVTVHKANAHDTKMGWWIAWLALFTYPTIERFCADRGYRGTFIHDVNTILQRGVDISEKIKPEGWHIEPKRWVVERTFAWLNNSRRLSKDYEILTSSSESMIKISHIHTLLKRM